MFKKKSVNNNESRNILLKQKCDRVAEKKKHNKKLTCFLLLTVKVRALKSDATK